MSNRVRIYQLAGLVLCLLCGQALADGRRATAASRARTRASVPAVAWLLGHSGLGPAAYLQAGAQGDRPVEQVRKNIQVLKGMPDAQLFPVMNFISSSLGVRCAYCHVSLGKDAQTGRDRWAWESDDKPEKQTARRMMQMVLAVNSQNRADFRDNAVTCYTCHRGQTKPAALPSLPLAASAHEPGPGAPAAETAKVPETLPTVEQVLNRYAEAVGGRAAVARLQSSTLKGTYEASQGRNWPMEVTVKEPGRYLVTLTTPRGPVQQSVSGDAGWSRDPQGVRPLTPAEVAQFKRAALMYEPLKAASVAGMKVVGAERVGERPAYVVESPAEAGRVERLYFDRETGLLLRRLVLTNTMLGPLPEQTDFEDYHEVDGLRLPFTIRISAIDTFNNSTRRFTEVRPNVSVDETLFAMPAVPPK